MMGLLVVWIGAAWAGHAGVADTRAEAWSQYVERDFERFVLLMEQVRARSATTKDLYNLACGYALTGQSDRAVALLSDVVGRGWTDDLRADSDLASLRGRPDFEGLADQVAYAERLHEKLEPARARAFSYYHAGQYAAFVEVMEIVAQMSHDEEDLYNLACGYALVGRDSAALDTLDHLAAWGAPLDPRQDEDFERLRGQPRFDAVAARMAAAASDCG
jgi:hypothetical protein